MKKLFTLCLFVVISAISFAQPCTPLPNWNNPGISPARLADAEVGVPYNQTITFVVPIDTSVVFSGTLYNVKIDSARILSITGYPNGFSYQADKPSLTWPGGSKGCARLSGTATESQVGDYSIYVKVQTWFKIVGLSNQFEQIDSSQIDFKVKGTTGIKHFAVKQQIKTYPNPAKNILNVDLSSYSNSIEAKVFDILGNIVSVEPINGSGLKYNISNLKSGIYFIELKDGRNIYVSRFIKE
ncbi:MAG: T9SS type A sorting domain-containing protein [Bacteroidia bacterium]